MSTNLALNAMLWPIACGKPSSIRFSPVDLSLIVHPRTFQLIGIPCSAARSRIIFWISPLFASRIPSKGGSLCEYMVFTEAYTRTVIYRRCTRKNYHVYHATQLDFFNLRSAVDAAEPGLCMHFLPQHKCFVGNFLAIFERTLEKLERYGSYAPVCLRIKAARPVRCNILRSGNAYIQ
jgi:hypothetical protein